MNSLVLNLTLSPGTRLNSEDKKLGKCLNGLMQFVNGDLLESDHAAIQNDFCLKCKPLGWGAGSSLLPEAIRIVYYSPTSEALSALRMHIYDLSAVCPD
jgi:hypothetical protein